MDWAALTAGFKAARVLVVGDICLDFRSRYDPALAEPSRETGIPRTGVVHSEATPGAGGTVAGNLAALGVGRVAVLGAIGRDGFGFELKRALHARQIDAGLLVECADVQTFTYTKLINAETGVEDKPRTDFVNTKPLPRAIERRLIANLSAVHGDYDAILVADQAETDSGGVVTPALRAAVGEIAARYPGKTIVADSRNRIHEFRNVIVKPNESEAERACLRLFGEIDYQRLRRVVGVRPLVVTRGERGILLIDDRGERLVPAFAAGAAVDTCGAGDGFAAGLAPALCTGAGMETAVRFGAMVAGVTVTKPGTGAASADEVLAAADSAAVRE